MPTKNSTLLSLIAARLVLTETAQSQPYLAMATLIAPDLAITPDHVFGNRRRAPRNVTLHFDGRTDLPIETEATVIARDPDFDIAALRLKSGLKINLPDQLLADADPPSGASWQSLMITPATPKGAYVTGTVAEPLILDGLQHLELLASRKPAEGASGAPIVVDDRIVGIMARGATANKSKFNQWFAIPISAVIQSKVGELTVSKLNRFRRSTSERNVYHRLSERAQDALSLANGIRIRMGRDSVHMEHLIAALFQKAHEAAQKVMAEARVDQGKVFEILSDHTKRKITASDTFEYSPLSSLPPLSAHARKAVDEAGVIASRSDSREILNRHLLYGALSVTECDLVNRLLELGLDKEKIMMNGIAALGGPLIAGYRSDEAEGKDLLGISREVEYLSAVLAAKDVAPPLSLGLFGDWGSGKSFFMRKMEERIRDFQIEAENDDNAPYCKKIVQLWFNAWHYIDTELWASLASEIFEGLAESLATQDDKEEVDYKRAQLIARQGELEAEKRKQREIEERLEEIERGKTEIESSPQRVIVEAYRFAERQPEAHQKVREVEKILNEKIKNAANELGVSPDDVKEQLLEAHGLFRQVRAIVSMGWAKNSKQWILKALAAIVIIPAAWTLLQIYYPVWQPIITKILAGLTTLLVVLKPHIKYARNLLAPLTAAIEENRKLLEEERVRLQKELEKQQKLTTEKSAEVAAVREDLENLRADRKLANFIKQRNASADYARYQGVIARAHADFEQLSDLLLREQKGTPDNSEPVLPRIDRIILYIDDLDRCPEDKVVKVLQAVHLLLAFPIFIVVVGVDPRWLLHSFRQYSSAFREIEEEGSLPTEENRHWRSTPLNYLEKIFQIPFTLRPMEKPGFEDLIEDLAKPQQSLPELKSEAKRENASLPAEETAEPGGAEPAGERADQIESPQSPQHGETSATMITDSSIPPVTKITAEHMRIEDWERKVMKKLFPLIPSPRAAKRFVNIYRLLRTSVPAENLAEFVGDEEQGKHRAALALLAILIGYPSEATDIIQALLELEQEPGKKSRNVEWGRFFQRFDPDKSAGKRTAPGDGGRQAAEAERWRELKTKLKETGLIHERQQCDDFIEWAEEVARYSFQSGRVLLKSERKLQPAAEKSSV